MALPTELLAEYFDWAPEAVALLDPDSYVILAANESFQKSVAPLTTVKGLPFVDTIVRSPDHGRMNVAIQSAVAGLSNPIVYGVQTLVLDADGKFPKWFSFDWMVKAHKSALVVSARQVTVVQEHDKELENEFADFFNKAPIALHWLSGTGHVLWANETEMKVLGYSPEEYIGQPIMNFCPDEEELVLDIFKQLGSGNTIRDVPVRFRTKTGEIKHLLIDSNVNWNPDGTFRHTRCFIRDDTARKINEARQLAEAKAQAEMVRQKDTFMQKIFHEIRTPCHTLQMTTQSLLDCIKDRDIRQQLETAWAQSVHISKMADDVKCAMLLQEGQAPILNEQWFQLSMLTDEVKTLVNNLFPKSTVCFEVVIENPNSLEDLLVLADMDILGTVLRHLLTNAMKFTEDGFVRLTVSVGEEDLNKAKQTLTFSVTNTGPPIDVDVVYRIWQKYWQGAEDLSPGGAAGHLCEKAGGFGLGLHISFNFVQLMGGQLQVKSDHDATVFSFSIETEVQSSEALTDDDDSSLGHDSMGIETQTHSHTHPSHKPLNISDLSDDTARDARKKKPEKKAKKPSKWLCFVPWAGAKQSARSQKAEPAQWSSVVQMPVARHHFMDDAEPMGNVLNPLAAASLQVRKVNVLVVDDNTICQRVVGKCLESLGFSYGVANNGKIALALVEADPKLYDMILMDLRMPVMDGVTATHEIRTKLHLTVPIIVFSAEIGKETKAEAIKAGATDFLEKPATPKSLLAMLVKYGLC